MDNKTPMRFTRLKPQTAAVVGKRNLKDYETLHRALEMLSAAEAAGLDLYDSVKILDSAS